MSSVFKGVAAVAAVVSLIPSPIQPIAQAVAIVATVGASLTQRKPRVPGSVSDITIAADQLSPYMIGDTYARLAMVLDKGYGSTLNGVPNPYRSWVFVASAAGPIESIDAIQADFTTIGFSSGAATGYYSGFLWMSSQLGACPEAAALAGPHGAIPQWGSSSKLSGKAAFLLTAKFDRKGKVWAAGVPQWGLRGKGVKVYDPRQDDTYSGGGDGDCRALEEGTYVGGTAAKNPGCHGVTYALGRWQGASAPRKVFGIGLAPEKIDWAAWVEFMNTCDANGWEIGGNIFEPGSRWDNLKRICQAGGGKPCWVGGLLSVRFPRPRTALDTITAADLAGPVRIPGMKRWRERLNTIVPKYRSADHRWEHVPAEAVVNSTYLAEDGEEKKEERIYELVQDKDQGAQLAAYDLAEGREIGPIVVPCKPRMIEYKTGDALELDLPEEDVEGLLCTVIGRHIDPKTAIVTLTLETETTAKHAWALGQTGAAPPSPTLSSPEDLDEVASAMVGIGVDEVADESAMVAYVGRRGDIVIREDEEKAYIHTGGSTGTAADWRELPKGIVP